MTDKKKTKNTNWSIASILSLSAIILGCNAESPTGTDLKPNLPPQENIHLYASDIVYTALENQNTTINVPAHVVTTPKKTQFQIKTVTPLGDTISEQCRNISYNKTEIHVNYRYSELCVYRYQVVPYSNTEQFQTRQSPENINSYAEGIITVAVQPAGAYRSAPLTLISLDPTIEGHEPIKIDLNSELQYLFPTGISSGALNNSVVVIGSGVAKTNPVDNTITYSDGKRGANRIIYSIKMPDDTIRVGAILIPVSLNDIENGNPGNRRPIFKNFTYNSGNAIKEGETITIDLAQNAHLTDLDDKLDTLQITGLHSSNAETKPENEALNNLKFQFTAQFSGTYHVAIDVSDHNGGYTTGVVMINVKSRFDDILVPIQEKQSDLFSAPLTMVQSKYLGFDAVKYTETEVTGPKNIDIAVMDYTVAKAMCNIRGGQLPNADQITRFIENEHDKLWISNDLSQRKWPIGKPYFTQVFSMDASNTESIEMVTFSNTKPVEGESLVKKESVKVEDARGYVSCVDVSPVSIKIDNNYALIDAPDELAQYLTASYDTQSGANYSYTNPLIWDDSNTGFLEVEKNNDGLDHVIGKVEGVEEVTTTNNLVYNNLTISKELQAIKNRLLANDAITPFIEFDGDVTKDNLRTQTIESRNLSSIAEFVDTPLGHTTPSLLPPSSKGNGSGGKSLKVVTNGGNAAGIANIHEDSAKPEYGIMNAGGYQFDNIVIPKNARYIAVTYWRLDHGGTPVNPAVRRHQVHSDVRVSLDIAGTGEWDANSYGYNKYYQAADFPDHPFFPPGTNPNGEKDPRRTFFTFQQADSYCPSFYSKNTCITLAKIPDDKKYPQEGVITCGTKIGNTCTLQLLESPIIDEKKQSLKGDWARYLLISSLDKLTAQEREILAEKKGSSILIGTYYNRVPLDNITENEITEVNSPATHVTGYLDDIQMFYY